MNKFSQLSFTVILLGLISITGCATIPKDALTLSHESLAERQMQTRKYETKDEAKISRCMCWSSSRIWASILTKAKQNLG